MLVLILFIQLIAIIYWLIRKQYSYWTDRNFPCDTEVHIPYGTLRSAMQRETSMGVALYNAYLRSADLPFVGIYLIYRPTVMIRDPELARKILTQDFVSFHDRGVYLNERFDKLSGNLFSLRGQSWRSLRQKLTPSFTSGKLKAMFSTSNDVGDKMVDYMQKMLPEKDYAEIDLKDICVTYALDIIGSVIFGLNINSYEEPENKFRNLVDDARQKSVIIVLWFLCPFIIKLMAFFGFKNDTTVGLRQIMKDTIEFREKNNVIRKDMLQLMMQLKNTGQIHENDDNFSAKPNKEIGEQKEFTLDDMAAQGFIFYMAGQETTSASAAYTVYELAQNEKLLKRALNEIDEVLERHAGELSYDALREMTFLESCLQETNRKYPLPFLNRECTRSYTIPGTNHVIEKGTAIIIPLLGIHRDAKYFPNPMTYDPERFTASSPNYSADANNALMPFGAGPHQCIALRMGLINSKLCIVKILKNFNIELMSKREIEIDNHSFGIQPKGGLKVRLSKRV